MTDAYYDIDAVVRNEEHRHATVLRNLRAGFKVKIKRLREDALKQAEEIDAYKTVVQRQAEEIERLRAEIEELSEELEQGDR